MATRAADPEARIRRARALVVRHPASAEPLTFFASLTELQQSISREHAGVVRGHDSFASALDFEAAADALPSLLTGLQSIAPPAVAAAAARMLDESHAHRRDLVHAFWTGERDGDPLRSFIAEALLQPFAERVASAADSSTPARNSDVESASDVESGHLRQGYGGQVSRTAPFGSCPICSDSPVVAVLREAAHGARRSLVCGFCLAEWTSPRLVCLACGEGEFAKLGVHRADAIPGSRIDACETCRHYLKTIDLTQDATAVPVVDDIATVALDLWAREQGYTRLRLNLLRL
jgi:formate dehydrogenase accessory protein FdhE